MTNVTGREKSELADKPGSVENDHSSRAAVTGRLQQPTRKDARATRCGLPHTLPYLVLLRVGFAVPVCCQTRGALLPHRFTLA